MKKLMTWTIAVLLVLVLSACSAKTKNTTDVTEHAEKQVSNTQQTTAPDNNTPQQNTASEEQPPPDTDADLEMNYEIKKELFIQDDVRVEYPVIFNLKDGAKEKKINKLIKDEALETYLNTLQGLESGQTYTAEGSCEIKLKSDKFLSIAYSSYNNFTPSVHPYSLFSTTNIDMETGKKLALTDIVPKIDTYFINALKQAEYVGVLGQEHTRDIKSTTFDSYASDEDLIYALSQGAENNVFFYLTDKAIGISMPVAHAAGDHAEFEIPLAK